MFWVGGVQDSSAPPLETSTTLIENAARARIRGLEIEVEAKFSDRLTAGFAYGRVDPQYLDVGRVPNLTLSTSFQRTPRHSFTTSLDYSLALGSNTLSLHGDYSYRSHEQFQLLIDMRREEAAERRRRN